jgi:hypothetical protein
VRSSSSEFFPVIEPRCRIIPQTTSAVSKLSVTMMYDEPSRTLTGMRRGGREMEPRALERFADTMAEEEQPQTLTGSLAPRVCHITLGHFPSLPWP